MMAGQADLATAPTRWQPPRPTGERSYAMNCWWVAALCEEVTQDLLGRWLCDTPALLYRRGDGTAMAIEDRCPHRSAPFSLGCRKGDNVECGYHGFTFAPDGSCVRVPSMKSPPPALRIRSCPVLESYVQRVPSRDPRPTHLLDKSVKADGPGVQARRIVARWMERETT